MNDRITYAKNAEWLFKTGEIQVMFVELLWLEYTSTLSLLLIWKAKEGAGEEQEHRLTSNGGIMAADSVLV